MSWADTWAQLNGLFELEFDLDGERTFSPLWSAIVNCKMMLKENMDFIDPPDRIIADPNGSIIAEWQYTEWHCKCKFTFGVYGWTWTSDVFKHRNY